MYVAITTLAALTFVLSAFSLRLQRIGLPPLVLALLAGVLAGPALGGLVDPEAVGIDSYGTLEEMTRFVLTVSLLGVALRLPRGYWRANRRWLVASIGVAMPIMLAVSTGALLLLGIPFLTALLVAACITPTDPVVSTPIVTGPLAEERIPRRVRFNISGESGLNDGLAFLFVMLPVLLLTGPVGAAWEQWALEVLLWQVGVPVVGGIVVGWAAGELMDRATERGWTMSSSYLGYGIALAVTVLAALRLLDTDAILAVFVAGAVFSDRITDELRRDLGAEVDALSRVVVLPTFALVGAMLPWAQWAELSPLLPVVLLLALVARRLIGVWATRPIFRPLHTRAETAFLSWFGPVGVSALFYASTATERTGDDFVFPAVTMAIALSVLVHGLTATPAGRWLARADSRE